MKYLKYFENNSKDLSNNIIPKDVLENINDILLDMSDNGYTYKLEYYIDESDWVEAENVGVFDNVKSIMIEFSGFGPTQPNGDSKFYLLDGDKYINDRSKYAEALKLVLEHLINYIKSIDYKFNIHHASILYGKGRKEIKINWELGTSVTSKVSKFIDYFIYQGGSISICTFNKYL